MYLNRLQHLLRAGLAGALLAAVMSGAQAQRAAPPDAKAGPVSIVLTGKKVVATGQGKEQFESADKSLPGDVIGHVLCSFTDSGSLHQAFGPDPAGPCPDTLTRGGHVGWVGWWCDGIVVGGGGGGGGWWRWWRWCV